ncbi:hypothetical protein WKW50_05365 [Ochrobactrum sp. GPK 3]
MQFDDVWTPKLVGEVLIEAAMWSIASAGRTGPAGDRSLMPDLLMTEDERKREDWSSLTEGEPEKKRRALSPARVSLLEKAIEWPFVYLDKQEGAARVLQLWLRCKCTRYRFIDAVDHRKWSRATAYRRRDRALSLISQGLDRDGVRVPRS